MAALEELDRVHEAAKRDPSFWTELNALLKDYVGRPTPLTEAPRLGEQVGAGVVVALKREDLNHTGRSEEHTSELQSQSNLVCRLLLEKKKKGSAMILTATDISSERANSNASQFFAI